MSVEIKKIVNEKYGACLSLSNEAAELHITVDMGPRVIYYALKGKENMFAQLTDSISENGWNNIGGHRLWHAPEAMPRSYEHDDKPVHYELIENGVLLTQPIEKWAMVEKEIEIRMDDETPTVSVVHRLYNRGAWPIEMAAWAISVMAPGGKEVIPMTQRDTGLLSNRTMAIWPYSKMNDNRVWFGERYITLQQDENCAGPFKIGINNEYGWVTYFNKGCVFIKQHAHEIDEKYPDGGMSLETYTCNTMTEVETLSPMTTVEPDDFVEHVELWTLVEGYEAPANDDDEIDAAIDEIMEACGAYEECGCGCDCEDCEEDCDGHECGGDCDCEDDGCDCGCGHHHHHHH